MHFWIGVGLYVIVRLIRWRATLPWKVSAAAGVIALAAGITAFLAPWAHERWSSDYWVIYNRTYRWNYDASLRVCWAPLFGLVWLVGTLGAHGALRRKHRSHR